MLTAAARIRRRSDRPHGTRAAAGEESEERVRLSARDVATIKQLVADSFGHEARVWLFGSQLDDRRSGGDVDLTVEIPPEAPGDLWTELRLARRLEEALDGRKVDLIVHRAGEPEGPFVRIARRQGVLL